MIIDVDIHHGNGTENIVLGDSNILYFSIHQSPLYPGTGLTSKFNCINIPLPPETKDKEYCKILDTKLKQSINEFHPDIIGISIGLDAYYKDIGWVAGNQFRLTTDSYKKLKEIVEDYPYYLVLEGGYNPESILEGVSPFLKQ
jgi:acetoin utilization deacetylase AcuC-like enzyme